MPRGSQVLLTLFIGIVATSMEESKEANAAENERAERLVLTHLSPRYKPRGGAGGAEGAAGAAARAGVEDLEAEAVDELARRDAVCKVRVVEDFEVVDF